MHEELLALIKTFSSITSKVDASKIRWGSMPQSTAFPYVILRAPSEVNELHMNGKNKLTDFRVQVDCFAKSYGEAELIKRAFRDELIGYRAANFRLIQDGGSFDPSPQEEDGSTSLTHLKIQDFIINWRSQS